MVAYAPAVVRPAAPPEDDTSYLRRLAEASEDGATVTTRVVVQSARSYGSGWARATVRPEDGRAMDTFTVVGDASNLEPGHVYEITGGFVTHPKYGEQLECRTAVPVRAATVEGIRRYLMTTLQGLGPMRAGRLVKEYGAQTLDVLSGSEAEALHALTTHGQLTPAAAAEVLRQHREMGIKSQVSAGLQAAGCTPSVVERIWEAYKDKALEVIRRDPYGVAEAVKGIGFVTIDAVARRAGVRENDPKRCEAAAAHMLREAASKGHTWQTAGDLARAAKELHVTQGDLEAALARHAKRHAADGDAAPVWPSTCGTGYAARDYADAERSAARWIQRALSIPAPELGPDGIKGPSTLTDEQRAGVKMALTHRVSILTGPPGTGKTFALDTVLRNLSAHGRRTVLAAPTGKAAVRMTESTGRAATTIHRLLGWQGDGRWERNEANPIEAEHVVIDESSMVDVPLFAGLLAAIDPAQTALTLVGDVNQIPSVGAGCVLRDMIESGRVPTTVLTQIQRQAQGSYIIRNAHALLRGEDIEGDPRPQKDFVVQAFDSETDEAVIAAAVVEAVSRRARSLGFDARDCQVLCATHRGACGTRALNAALQSALNPGQSDASWKFRRGDRVIQTSNDYDRSVFNGEVGVVETLDRAGCVVDFGGGRLVEYDQDGGKALDLAYAITIHKSQGSEFPFVVMPAPRQASYMLTRQLVYTGVTRAKRFCAVIGHGATVARAARNTKDAGRRTQLGAMIQEG